MKGMISSTYYSWYYHISWTNPKCFWKTERLCDQCEYYGGGEVCDHPSIGEVEMGGKGDTFPWIEETPKWCPLTDEPQTERSE